MYEQASLAMLITIITDSESALMNAIKDVSIYLSLRFSE